MKKIFYLVLILAVTAGNAAAQQKITVNVKAETEYDKILPAEMVYEFKDFQPGKLYYMSGSVVNHNFNYNLSTKALLFKDKSDRVLEFAFPHQIRMVMIDSSYWVPLKEGLGKIVYNRDSLDLIKFRETVCTDIRKEGAFGGMSSTSAITNISSIQGSGSSRMVLAVKGEYDFETKVSYLLKIGEKIEFADAKGFRKLFPRQKNEINNFIKSRKLNLDKESDIIELIKVLTFE